MKPLGLTANIRHHYGDVAERLGRSVSNHARFTRVGSNPVVGITNHKPKVHSAVRLLRLANEYSEVTLRAQALDTH